MSDRVPDQAPPTGDTQDQAVIATGEDALISMDEDGIVTAWNKAAERIFGFTEAEMIGQPVTTLLPPGRLAEAAALRARIERGERLTHFETERLTRDGKLVPVSLTIIPLKGQDGKGRGAEKTVRDLTELKRLNEELTQRRAILESILDTVPDGLIVIDDGGIVRSFSHAAERIFGYAAEEVVGHTVNVLMPQSQSAAHDAYMERYLATGQRRIIGVGRVVVAQRKDGSRFPLELQVGEVHVPGAHLFTGFMRDLTERQERDRRLAALQAELIHVSRLSALGQMVTGLAHEVNQPLAAISNYVAGIRRMLPKGGALTLSGAIENIAEQTDRACEIVDSLRSLVKKDPRPRRAEDLSTMIRETATLALSGSDNAIALEIALATNASSVLVDKVQIQQVLFNLMRNAAEAMIDAPIRVLRIESRRVADRVEICIGDTGPGLPEMVRQKLFHPFVSTKSDGLGVGLSICQTIVQAHDGELTAEDRPGGGSLFRFTVPSGAAPASTTSEAA
jgi:two-component system sensor kinase FixL